MTGLYEILGVPFGFVLKLIYESIGLGNYALSIILLTLLSRLLMVPSTISQQKGMAKTQRIQAKIRKIQEKYQGDQRRIQEETQNLYQREGYNPMNAGCGPMIFQFVLLFGLIGAIYYPLSNFLGIAETEVTALVNAVSTLSASTTNTSIIKELMVIKHIGTLEEMFLAGQLQGVTEATINAIKDINFTVFGISLGEVPSEHKTVSVVWLVPALSFLSSMLTGVHSMIKQKKTNPATANNPMMGCMMFGMPLLSLWFVINYPIGIGVYWIASSVFGFISTVLIGHFYSPKKTLAKLMIEETVERRSKEENIKLIAANKDKE